MPDSTEVAAAAERRMKHDEAMRSGRDRDSPYRSDYTLQVRDTAILADAYRAEHDPSEITDDVLRQCGFETTDWDSWACSVGEFALYWYGGDLWIRETKTNIRTDGALRTLLRVLRGET